MTKSKSKQKPVFKPYLAEVKGIEISVSGKFAISDNIIRSIRSTLDKDCVTSHESKDKTHRFTIQARSFVDVSADRAALEIIHIRHCEGRVFHFDYYLTGGPKKGAGGKPLVPGYDDDVQRVIAHLSKSRAKRDLKIEFELPPETSKRSSQHLAGVIDNLPVAGLKLLIREDPDSKEVAHLEVDWEDPSSVKSSVTLRKKMPITKSWPQALIREFKSLGPALRNVGVSHGSKD